MARKKTTIYLDEPLLRAAKVFAARTGKREYEVVEDALRQHLGLDVLDTVWARNTLDGDEALELANSEKHAARPSS